VVLKSITVTTLAARLFRELWMNCCSLLNHGML